VATQSACQDRFQHQGNAEERRIMVTSSLEEISTDRMGNRVIVRGGRSYPPAPFLQQASGQINKDDVSVFFSISDNLLYGF
jgi:hypothetical protein